MILSFFPARKNRSSEKAATCTQHCGIMGALRDSCSGSIVQFLSRKERMKLLRRWSARLPRTSVIGSQPGAKDHELDVPGSIWAVLPDRHGYPESNCYAALQLSGRPVSFEQREGGLTVAREES